MEFVEALSARRDLGYVFWCQLQKHWLSCVADDFVGAL